MFKQFAAAVIAVIALVSSLPAYASSVTFAYQGRVKVTGQAFNGNGQFKLAILDTAGNSTLWSHDGTSVNGGEPTGGALSLPVVDGIFNIMVGDTAAGQQPISATLFADGRPLKLRVWFNGGQGFQQLVPDQNLANLTVNVLESGNQDFSIYVNQESGNDANNGLTVASPKKTIQAAVDILPDRLRCNITIDIANGTYKEQVELNGISAATGKKLTLFGDESWTSATASAPAVVITGADDGTSAVRAYALHADQCSSIELRGLHFTRAFQSGAFLQNGGYRLHNCMASFNNGWAGFKITRQADVNMYHCVARDNVTNGMWANVSSRLVLENCASIENGHSGLFVQAHTSCDLVKCCNFSDNDSYGLRVWTNSYVGCDMPLYMDLANNKMGSIEMYYGAQMMAYYYNTQRGTLKVYGNLGTGNTPLTGSNSNIWW